MKRSCSRLLAAAAALALSVQSTGAASLPIALMTPRAAFPPPASRLAAFPAARPAAAAKTPAGRSWLESARVVSDFVLARVREELSSSYYAAEPAPKPESQEPETPMIAITAAPPAADADHAPAIITPLGVDAPPDRMMIVMEPGRRVDAVLSGQEQDFSTPPTAAVRPAPVLPPFRERWQEMNGLRARVSYLRSHGLVKLDAGGATAAFADGTTRRAPSQTSTRSFRGEFPIYFHDEVVEIELTVENKTGRTLRDVRLEAVQETFRPVGTEGAMDRALVGPRPRGGESRADARARNGGRLGGSLARRPAGRRHRSPRPRLAIRSPHANDTVPPSIYVRPLKYDGRA